MKSTNKNFNITDDNLASAVQTKRHSMKLRCIDCLYFYADCDEQGNAYGSPYCHYGYDDGCAPCEVDDAYVTLDED